MGYWVEFFLQNNHGQNAFLDIIFMCALESQAPSFCH